MERIEPSISYEEYKQMRSDAIIEDKQLRVALDGELQKLKFGERQSRERCLAINKLEECIMWLGMDLKAIGEPHPFPMHENLTIDPTIDGLKL